MKELAIDEVIRIRCVEDEKFAFSCCVKCVFRSENCEYGKMCRSSERKDRRNVHYEIVED